jgi:hypothetical protein
MNFDKAVEIGMGSYNVLQKIREELDKTGFREMEKPTESEPPPPAGLGDRTDRELGDLYDEYGVWWEYLSNNITMLEVCVEQAKQLKEMAYAYAKQTAAGAKAERGETAKLDIDFITANSDHLDLSCLLNAQKSRLHRIGKGMERISRHITLRQDGTGHLKRGHNVGGYRPRRS